MKKNFKDFLVLFAVGLILFVSACGNGAVAENQMPSVDLVDAGLFIDVDKAFQLREEGIFLLDVRTPAEWTEGHIPGAFLIPLDELPARLSELPEDQDILIYCRSGNRSAQALSILQNAGFSTVYSMTGGINDWVAAGYPVE